MTGGARIEGLGCGALELRPDLRAQGRVALEWSARPDAEGLIVEGALLAQEAVALSDIYFDIRFLELNINPSWRFFRHGYASWTPSASFPLRAPPARPLSGSFAVANHPVDTRPWREDRRAMVGHGFGALGAPEASLFVGHLTSEVGLSVVAWTGDGRLIAGLEYGGRRLEAGERLALEPLRLAWGAPEEALDRWTHEVAARAGVSGAFATRPSPVGWCSWYHFYTSVKDEDMVRNAERLAALPELGVKVVQLDDGYQAAIGDWRRLNDKFSRGFAPMVADIRAAGFEAGLWTAPFYVGRRSQLYREHPAWILRDARGRPIDCGINPAWMDRLVGLDLSHPDALSWLRGLFSGLRAEGFTFFKLDFLYAALRTAAAYDPRQSPVERYRRGLRVIREGAGPDSFILGCGAPMLPSVGLVDGMRVSADVKEAWAPGALGWLGSDCGAPSLREAARNNLTRASFHRRFWLNDPDCLLVRDRDTALGDDEVGLLVAVAGLSGGLGLVSDDMSAVPEARLDLLRRVLPPHGGRPNAPDLFSRDFPETFALEGEGRRLVCHLNWGSAPRRLPLEGSGLWRFDLLRLREIPEPALEIAPHGVRALLETPRLDHPRLVATDGHLAALTEGRPREVWSAEQGALTLEAWPDGARRGWIGVPAGWRLVEGAAHQEPGLLRVDRPTEGTLTLRFRGEPQATP